MVLIKSHHTVNISIGACSHPSFEYEELESSTDTLVESVLEEEREELPPLSVRRVILAYFFSFSYFLFVTKNVS